MSEQAERRIYTKEFELTAEGDERKEHLELLAKAETAVQENEDAWKVVKSEHNAEIKQLREARDNHLAAVNHGKYRATLRVYDVVSENGLELHTKRHDNDELIESRLLTASERQMSLQDIVSGKRASDSKGEGGGKKKGRKKKASKKPKQEDESADGDSAA